MRTVFELLSSDGSIRARIRSASSGHESSPILSLRCKPKSILELVQIRRQEGPAVRFRGRGRGIRKLLCYFQPIVVPPGGGWKLIVPPSLSSYEYLTNTDIRRNETLKRKLYIVSSQLPLHNLTVESRTSPDKPCQDIITHRSPEAQSSYRHFINFPQSSLASPATSCVHASGM